MKLNKWHKPIETGDRIRIKDILKNTILSRYVGKMGKVIKIKNNRYLVSIFEEGVYLDTEAFYSNEVELI